MSARSVPDRFSRRTERDRVVSLMDFVRGAALWSAVGLLVLFASWAGPADAATTLAATPITWGVVGLDSNDVSVGPNHFPVGARVCVDFQHLGTPVSHDHSPRGHAGVRV